MVGYHKGRSVQKPQAKPQQGGTMRIQRHAVCRPIRGVGGGINAKYAKNPKTRLQMLVVVTLVRPIPPDDHHRGPVSSGP